ncbi:flavodoxin family protein [Colwelliaceae bacterium 6441]
MKKTIAILGSSRRNGNTGKMIDSIAECLDIEVIDLNNLNISGYDYEHKNIDDDFLATIKHVLSHDHIIFASPVYWYSMSAQMKIFFDRISSLLSIDELKPIGRRFREKTAYLVTTSASEQADQSFIEVFNKTFAYLGMHSQGFVHAYCENDYQARHHQHAISAFTRKISSE